MAVGIILSIFGFFSGGVLTMLVPFWNGMLIGNMVGYYNTGVRNQAAISLYPFPEDPEGGRQAIIRENKRKYQNSLFPEMQGLTFESKKYKY